MSAAHTWLGARGSGRSRPEVAALDVHRAGRHGVVAEAHHRAACGLRLRVEGGGELALFAVSPRLEEHELSGGRGVDLHRELDGLEKVGAVGQELPGGAGKKRLAAGERVDCEELDVEPRVERAGREDELRAAVTRFDGASFGADGGAAAVARSEDEAESPGSRPTSCRARPGSV